MTAHKDEFASRRRYTVALTGIVLYVVLDAIAQLLPPHYNPISQAESDLAVGPYGYIMTINFLNRGLLSLEFLFAFLGTVRLVGGETSKFRTGKFLFGVWSVGALLLAAFPTDVPPTPVSWHGAIHLIVAILAFLGGGFGALSISLNMSAVPSLARLRRIALPISVVSLLALALEIFGPARFGGLTERIFLGTVLLWVACVSAYMLTRNPVTTPPETRAV